MSIGKRIAELRKQKNMSQSELAKALNVAPSTIGMWETDQRAMKDDSIRQLSKYFGVSTDYLLNGYEGFQKERDRSFKESNEKIRTIAAHIDDDATEEDLEDILRYIEYRKNNPLKKKK